MHAIETEDLAKRFGAHRAVDGVALAVPAGQVYGFLGPNGAGKTTTLRLLLGLLRPERGRIRLLGRDLARERLAIMREVGALIETPALYDHLSGRANLDLTRRVLGLPKTEIDRVLETAELGPAANRRVGGYSLGMRQRLALARALLGRPKLLLLDEPTNGLDPDGIHAMRRLIRELPDRAGATVFMSSHLLSEVEQTASVVGLMHAGKLVLQERLEAICGPDLSTLVFELDDPPRGAEVLARSGADVVRTEGARVHVRPPPAEDGRGLARRLNRVLVEAGLGVSRIAPEGRTLEQVYLAATGARAAA